MSWEGSSWREPAVPHADRLRFALIVPRVLAPHPNRGPETELRPDQALALAVLVRLGNLRDYSKGIDDVPNISEMGASVDWGWRLVDAFRVRVLDEDPGPLVTVAHGAPDASSAAASAAAAACALLDSDRIEDAISFLSEALDRTDYGVVDRAWLEIQRARLQRQVGRLDEASEGARGARDALSSVAGDPTADAIAAAATTLIERPGDLNAKSFAATMIAGDTVASWWRAQEVGRADNAIAQRAFQGWARDRSVTLGGEDAAVTGLLAAAMMSSHAADQGGWAARHAAIGRDGLIRLDRLSDPDEASSALGELRIGGDEKSLKLAVARLLSDGPAAAVARAARGVDLRRPTGSGLLVDLVLVERGGDVLEGLEAERLAGQLLEAIDDPDSLAARTRPSFLLEVQLLGSLTGILLAAGRRTWDAVIDRLPRLAPQEGQLAAREWANLVWTLPAEAWGTEDALRTAEGAARHDEVLEQALLGVAWRHGDDPVARDRLIEAARAGSLSALGELGNVTALAGDVAGELISALAARVDARTAKAREGTVSFGGVDPAEGLVVLDLWHQAVASWEPLLDLLGEDAVPASYKRRVLVILAASAGRIPAEVKTRLAPILRRLQVTEPARSSPFDPEPDARGPALELGIATGAVDSKAAAEITLPWLSGDADRRRWAAHAAYRLARPEDIGVLCVLAADRDPSVRASASAALAVLGRAAPGGEDPAALALRMAEADGGVEVASAVAGALASAGWRGELGERARRHFRDHLSAAVRAIAARDPDPDSLPGDDRDPGLDPFANPYGRQTLEQLRG
jgi:hypothetical protein